MNKIIVNLGNVQLDEIPLHRGSLNIGRAADNDISLADSATSAHHAKIVTIFTSSFIQDLNSTNGTIVNGRKVVRHTLHHGDIISIGNLQLLFKSDVNDSIEQEKKTIRIEKSDINRLLEKSSAKARPVRQSSRQSSRQPVNSPFDLSSDDSVPAEPDKAERQHQTVNADVIPVLKETLPLNELRKNPDRMVVLTPKSASGQKVPVGLTKTNSNQAPLDMWEDEDRFNDSDQDTDSPTVFQPDAAQIRTILEKQNALSTETARLVAFAIGIVLLVVFSITLFLLL